MIYLTTFFILASFSYLELTHSIKKNNKKLLEWVVVIYCIIISSIRTGEAGDYYTYKQVFDNMNIENNIFNEIFIRTSASTEYGYNLLNYIVKIFTNNYQWFIATEAILTNLILYKFFTRCRLNNKKNEYVITCFYIVTSLGFYNINIVRQTIAVSICLLSINAIVNKQLIKFLLSVVVAGAFHRSAYIWLIAYFIFHINLNRKRFRNLYIIFLMGSFIISCVSLPLLSDKIPGIMGEKLTNYLSVGMSSYGGAFDAIVQIIKSLFNVILLLICFKLLYRYNKFDKFFVGCFNLYLFGSMIIFVSCFTSNQFARIATPFSMVSIVLLLYLFKNLKSRSVLVFQRKIIINRGGIAQIAMRNVKISYNVIFIIFACYLFLRLYMTIGNSFFSSFTTIF